MIAMTKTFEGLNRACQEVRMIDPITLLVLMILACWGVLEKCRRIRSRHRKIYGGRA